MYRPPFDEFEVLRVEVPAGQSEIVTAKHVRTSSVHGRSPSTCRSLMKPSVAIQHHIQHVTARLER